MVIDVPFTQFIETVECTAKLGGIISLFFLVLCYTNETSHNVKTGRILFFRQAPIIKIFDHWIPNRLIG
jgi:hypothetical protein